MNYEFEKSQILIYGRFSIEVLNTCNHSSEIVDFPLFQKVGIFSVLSYAWFDWNLGDGCWFLILKESFF